MNSILISMPPKKVARLLNRQSRIMFVKGKPKCDFPSEAYIYCTQMKNHHDVLVKHALDGIYRAGNCFGTYDGTQRNEPLNGKVVAKFTLTNAEKVYEDEDGVGIFTDTLDDDMLYKLSGVGHDDLDDSEYDPALAKGNLYAWYAAWAEVLDVPMELSEFKRRIMRKECISCAHRGDMVRTPCPEFALKPIKKAPSGWMYVETEGEQE